VSLFTISLFFRKGAGSRSPAVVSAASLVATNREVLPCAIGIDDMGRKNADAEEGEEGRHYLGHRRTPRRGMPGNAPLRNSR
jgi:hypothetical protein